MAGTARFLACYATVETGPRLLHWLLFSWQQPREPTLMFSKIYKLWIEIEECVPDLGEFRDLSSEGQASPVPLAEFDNLDEAVDYAESFASDHRHPRRPDLN